MLQDRALRGLDLRQAVFNLAHIVGGLVDPRPHVAQVFNDNIFDVFHGFSVQRFDYGNIGKIAALIAFAKLRALLAIETNHAGAALMTVANFIA